MKTLSILCEDKQKISNLLSEYHIDALILDDISRVNTDFVTLEGLIEPNNEDEIITFAEGKDGYAVPVRIPRKKNGKYQFTCGIDWVSITVDKFFFTDSPDHDDEQIVQNFVNNFLLPEIGLSISHKRPTGLNFYDDSYVIGYAKGDNFGHICIGGQRDTLFFSLNGSGCVAAKKGWERALSKFLQTVDSSFYRANITRCDVFADLDASAYNPDKAYQDFLNGDFTLRRSPRHERVNFDNPHEGRTFYVGSRKGGGKLARIYEKGKQLGSPESSLVRVEVEFLSRNRKIPFDIFISPANYLVGAYPAFQKLSHAKPMKTKTFIKKAQISYDKLLDIVKLQYGKFIDLAVQVEGGAENLIKKIARSGVPSRLVIPTQPSQLRDKLISLLIQVEDLPSQIQQQLSLNLQPT